MTVVLEPATTVGACPPWCYGDPDWHDPDTVVLHDGLDADLPMTAKPIFGRGSRRRPDRMHVTVSSRDGRDPVVWLAMCNGGLPTDDGAYASLDEVEEIGRHLVDLVAKTRGSKAARDLRLGDRIVLDGEVHEVVFLLIDACSHDVEVRCCAGHVQIYTDRSEAVCESTPAVTLDPADLVEVAR